MSVENNAPEIRFKGFSGEWADATLSDVIDVRSGKDYKHLGKGDIPVYGTGGYMLSVDNALSNDEDAIGIGRKGTIDKPYLLRAPFWTVDTLFYAVPRPKFKLDYLYCLFQKIDWKKHDESTGVPSLSKVAINNIPVRVTNEKEQTAIGNTFQKLDNLINQHQQKHDKLSSLKKAMLEKMFPKQGETIPEIRFKGFSGEWEESNLEKCTDLLTGNPFNSKEFTSEGFFLVRGMNVKRGYLDSSPDISEFWPSSEGLERYLLEPEDIVVQMDGALIGKSYAKIKSINLPAILVQRVTRIRCSEVNSEFIYQYIQKDFLKHISGIKTETAVPHLSLHDIRAFSIFLPEIEEQNSIGSYFQKLDALINQHQQQITKLNNIKQACLSKMFV
ncbi:restriction endonuclease subunit S [Pseudoalteromonas ruthenica]|uniref:restriction endonuclease subunit S n=1 Tax=Pseudoalteromonas ruthenica TaxID=151081 RepID=UPI00241E0EAA|nr:restriction endonuclease subunit S [Pseudoalteromonas ruthenica]|tara:strand:+ start:4785 stop:5945 length:1161 start_codon:yes stop_codon:yes gene_type:complete